MQATECVHWFIISEANGPTSEGTCKHCGETRFFSNSTTLDNFKDGSKIAHGKDNRADGGDFYPGGDAGWTR